MKRIDDKIKLEYRDEIHDLIKALNAIPKDEQNETTKELLEHLEYMDWMW